MYTDDPDKNSLYGRSVELVVTKQGDHVTVSYVNIEEAIMALQHPEPDWVSAHIYFPGLEDGDINIGAWDMSFVPTPISPPEPTPDELMGLVPIMDDEIDATPMDELYLKGVE